MATPAPYILVRPGIEARPGLEAKLARPVFYELVEWGREESIAGERQFGVWSGGMFFRLGDPGEEICRGTSVAAACELLGPNWCSTPSRSHK